MPMHVSYHGIKQACSQKLQLDGSFVQNCGSIQQNTGHFKQNFESFQQNSGLFTKFIFFQTK